MSTELLEVALREKYPPAPYAPGSEDVNFELRSKIFELLDEVGREFPTMRLGQILSHLASRAESAVPNSMYDIEDLELAEAAEHWLNSVREYRSR